MTMTWRTVSKDEFFAVVGPLNVHPRSKPGCSIWETPNRTVIGRSTPGYLCDGPRTYQLCCDSEAN